MSADPMDTLLRPVPGAQPAGPCLEYDADTWALEAALRGTPERQFGECLYPAALPDGPQVMAAAAALLARSKDLRFACAWTRGAALSHGWAGLASGLSLVEGLLVRYGAALHPQPDPDDGDLTMRRSALGSLAAPEFLSHLRAAPLSGEAAMPLRALEIACWPEQAMDGEPPADLATVWNLLRDTATPSLLDAWMAADAAGARLSSLAPASCGADPHDLQPLLRLTQLLGAVALALQSSQGPDAIGRLAALRPRIESPLQALAEVERIAAWIARTQPRHPAGLLLERLRRLLMGQPFAAGTVKD